MAPASYEQRYAFILRANGGLIDYSCELVDTDMLDTAALGNRHRIVREIPTNPFSITLEGRADNPGGTREKTIALAEDFLDAVADNDSSRYEALFHPGLVSNIVGRIPYSGRRHSRDTFLALDFDFHADLFQPGTRKIGRFYRIACADEKAFCLMMKGTTKTLAGKDYEQVYGVVAQVFEDRISEIFIWLDTAHAEEVIFDNPFVYDRKPSPFPPFTIY